ncbi:Glyoxalase/Bleomycin resistance protein/Dihydroxybiphenyl dioxygenase [Trichodelitschia bisporula]|uniref:Glyoxalase/Bleomycin resistance protein/Dihydroxybiphenyl dioxygenase n=1 Tax=Trichodelitschia bisporula TaxID=703511 RepID=A0A6G1IB92_9PEZI|nr:Glyoxalase/Bleomycin resistance protein/Dihydroxybiphenyl dioxygenase [Trichodelitschia bisporula]
MKFSNPLLLAVASLTAAQTTTPRTTPVLGAVGIAVASIPNSVKFYTEVLGLKPTGQTYNTPQFDEVVLSLPYPNAGSAIVLMQWKTPKNTTNIPVKLAFYVPDVKAQIEKIRAAGKEIVLEPGSGKIGGVTLPTAMARDVDGYLLEFNPLSLLTAAPAKKPGRV